MTRLILVIDEQEGLGSGAWFNGSAKRVNLYVINPNTSALLVYIPSYLKYRHVG